MVDDRQLIGLIITSTASVIEGHKDYLTKLDQMIGDGDHGINMSRGFATLLEKQAELSELPFDDACKRAGMALVMSVGGASGPLFGSALMAFGKGRSTIPLNAASLSAMLQDGVDAIKARGKADVGAKTMLDVLVPVTEAIKSGASLADVRRVTVNAVEATKSIEATKGRAAFLGKRSIGHIDPGAQTVSLLINSVADVLEHCQ
jgi:phosphoenolpyruvate---glycerone phosphotransferase subunit DhaL